MQMNATLPNQVLSDIPTVMHRKKSFVIVDLVNQQGRSCRYLRDVGLEPNLNDLLAE
jgi:hypothetical protein